MASITDKLGVHIEVEYKESIVNDYYKTTLVWNGKEIDAWELGSGCSATAYAIKDKRCTSGYKVLVTCAKLDYVREGLSCMKYSNVHVPKIRKAGYVWDGIRYKYAYVMPLYYSLHSMDTDKAWRLFNSLHNSRLGWGIDTTPNDSRSYLQGVKLPKKLLEALYIILDAGASTYQGFGWSGWDVHGGNVMVDDRGNLVLIDVIFSEGKSCPQKGHNWGKA